MSVAFSRCVLVTFFVYTIASNLVVRQIDLLTHDGVMAFAVIASVWCCLCVWACVAVAAIRGAR